MSYTKLRYQEEVSFAKKIIEEQKREISIATDRYLSENRVFQDGDKIQITTPEHYAWRYKRGTKVDEKITFPESSRFAFVVGVRVSWSDDLEYILRKCKKDGTQSQHTDSYSSTDILTKVS